jgi:hypothetical protein
MNLLPKFYTETKFWNFILPAKEEISAKHVFDNVRNFGISAGIFAVSRVYRTHGGNAWEFYLLFSFGGLLLVLSSFQLWVLFLKIFYTFTSFKLTYSNITKKEHAAEFIKVIVILSIMLMIPYLIYKLITTTL